MYLRTVTAVQLTFRCYYHLIVNYVWNFLPDSRKTGVWNILKRFKDVLANNHGQSADISLLLQIERELCLKFSDCRARSRETQKSTKGEIVLP
jgi:hypothetical protein